jgi:hypothetical protein
MNLQFYRDSVNHHGIGATLYHAAYRAANHVTEVAVWNALVINLDMVNERFLTDPQRSLGRLVGAEEMRRYVSDPGNLLTGRFIDEAAAKGDRCYALFDGDRVMSYGWYSTRPTRLTEVASDAVIHFDPSYAYMYHGFTHPDYRSRRLHAVGMAAALEALTNEGLQGLVSYVVSSNFSSLKSCYRMGYQTFGHIVMVKLGYRHHWSATPGCKKYDFRVEAAAG